MLEQRRQYLPTATDCHDDLFGGAEVVEAGLLRLVMTSSP